MRVRVSCRATPEGEVEGGRVRVRVRVRVRYEHEDPGAEVFVGSS